MNSLNAFTPVNFSARFQKQPVKVTAEQQKEDFQVSNPWGEGMLNGKAGDWKIYNHLSKETYPCKQDSFASQYDHVDGDLYQTRMDKPVYIDADLPTTDTIISREGVEKTVRADGMPSMIVRGTADKDPYPVPADYFIQAYAPVDDEAKAVLEQLKTKMPKY